MGSIIINNDISISNIRLTDEIWKRVLLFQSMKQFNWFMVSVIISALIVSTIATYVFDDHGQLMRSITYFIIPSIIFGTLLHIAGMLQSRFIINTEKDTRAISKIIEHNIDRLGYKVKNRSASHHHHLVFSMAGAKLTTLNENKIFFLLEDHQMTLSGPVVIMSILKSRIIADIKALPLP
jgi:hypothetical protein